MRPERVVITFIKPIFKIVGVKREKLGFGNDFLEVVSNIFRLIFKNIEMLCLFIVFLYCCLKMKVHKRLNGL